MCWSFGVNKHVPVQNLSNGSRKVSLESYLLDKSINSYRYVYIFSRIVTEKPYQGSVNKVLYCKYKFT